MGYSQLNFPEFTFPFLSSDFKRRIRATSEVSVKYNWQIRPEFERTVASAAWSYRWSKHQANHRFDVLDVSYIYMPYRSQTFKEYLNVMDQKNPLLRYSYEDLFIVRMGYTYTYNSSGAMSLKTAHRNSYSIRFNIEESVICCMVFQSRSIITPVTEKHFRWRILTSLNT